MSVTSLPRITAQLLAARQLVGAQPYTALICGQIGTSGTAVSGQLYEDVESYSNSQIETLFGSASEITGRIKRARRNINGRFALNVIALTEDGGATDATLDIVTAGTATADGTIILKVIDQDLYTINVDVLTGDVAADVAADIKAAIDALTTLPATSGAITVATFTLTANDGGTIPNKYTVEVVQTVPGITVTAGQFTGGTNDPTLTGFFNNVTTNRFHAIGWPWEDDYSDVKTLLEGRNVIDNAFLHGVALIGYDDTEANISTKVNGGTPLNSPNLIFMGNRQISGVSQIITPPDWRVAEFISIEGLRLTDNAPIGSFVTVTSRRDVLGNIGLSSLAYYNTPLAITDIANPNNLFTGTEQVNLKNDGFSIVGVNPSKTSAIMGEVVTTYKFNLLGNNDVSFKFLNYVRTGYAALEIFFNTLKATYSQFRLTEGVLTDGRAIANQQSIEAEYQRIFQQLGSAEFSLVPAGAEANQYFNENLVIELDIANGTVTSSGLLPILTQIRDINMTFQLSFSIGG